MEVATMNTWLLSLTDAQISRGIDAVYDSTIRAELEAENSELQSFVYDQDLRAQAEWLAWCEFDRTAAQLSWSVNNG
jgi:hypothetical protein